MFSALDNLSKAGTLVGVGKILEIISKTELKKVLVSMNGSSINHGLMKNVQNL